MFRKVFSENPAIFEIKSKNVAEPERLQLRHSGVRNAVTRHGDVRDAMTRHGDVRDTVTRHGDVRDAMTRHGDRPHLSKP